MKPRRLVLPLSCAVVVTVVGLFGAAPSPVVAAAGGLLGGWTLMDVGPLGPADRDLLVQVRLAGLWEQQAGLQTPKRASSAKVIEVGEKIANEHADLDEVLRSVAAELGVALPEQPNGDQRGWLAEIAAARGAEFDRVFVDRLRVENGRLFSVIAGVRAGTRNELVRSFAATANDAVLRHMAYLESTGLVNFVTLPLPSVPGADSQSDGLTETNTGPLGAADRDLLVRVRLAGLWQQAAAAEGPKRASGPKVKEVAEKIANEQKELAEVVRSVSASLGVSVPDQPNAEQRGWLAEIAAARGEEFDRVFVDRLRADSGTLLSIIAGVRAGTRNDVVRSFAASANAAVLRHMAYLEGTGLVDFASLPLPPLPFGQKITGLQREDGVHPAAIWLLLATAGLLGAVTLARVLRSP